ncbi:MAG: hypothetical protein LBC53_05815 [Spirochaetaceae bacterium]|nr:hypothetical protein [Spirochaetaceae bacterium]
MWSKFHAVAGLVCILMYTFIAAWTGFSIFKTTREQKAVAEKEFNNLAEFAAGAGVLGFFSENFKDDVEDAVFSSKTLDAVVISGPDGKTIAIEKTPGSIVWSGEYPRFRENSPLFRKPFFTSLKIDGLRNTSLSAVSPVMEAGALLNILRTALFAAIITAAAAFGAFMSGFLPAPAAKNGGVKKNKKNAEAGFQNRNEDGPFEDAPDAEETPGAPGANKGADMPDGGGASENKQNQEAAPGSPEQSPKNAAAKILPFKDNGFLDFSDFLTPEKDEDAPEAGTETAPVASALEEPANEDLNETSGGATVEEAEDGGLNEDGGEEPQDAPPLNAFDEALFEEPAPGEKAEVFEEPLEEGEGEDEQETLLPVTPPEALPEFDEIDKPFEEAALREEADMDNATPVYEGFGDELNNENPKVKRGLLAAAAKIYEKDLFNEEEVNQQFIAELDRMIQEADEAKEDLALINAEWTEGENSAEDLLEAAKDFFGEESGVFSESGGVHVIVPDATLDEAFVMAKELHAKMSSQNAMDDSLVIGVSAKTGRKVNARRLQKEAQRALEKGREDSALPIVAFKVDVEKYNRLFAQEPDSQQ